MHQSIKHLTLTNGLESKIRKAGGRVRRNSQTGKKKRRFIRTHIHTHTLMNKNQHMENTQHVHVHKSQEMVTVL